MYKFLLIVLLITLNLNVQSQHVFNKQYYDTTLNSQNNFQRCNGVMQTSDRGYLVCGVGFNAKKMSAIKLNEHGDTLWSFIADYGFNGSDYLYTAIEARDGSFLVGGMSADATSQLSSAILVKLDRITGDTIWTSKFNLISCGDKCFSIKETQDNGFVFCGIRNYVNNLSQLMDSDVRLVKIDSFGVQQWEQTFGNVGFEWGQSLEIAADGSFMIFGTTDSYGEGSYDAYLIKTDSLGNMLWQKTYGSQYGDYGSSITKLQNGDYILAGGSSVNADTTVAVAIRINAEGTEIWNKRYTPLVRSVEFTGVKQLATGEIIVCGDEQGDTLNNSYYGILKSLDVDNGNVNWERQYQLFEDDSTQHYFYSMDTCSDGGLVMGGMILDRRGINSVVGNSYWVVKTDCAGNEYAWDNDACPKFVELEEEIQNETGFNLYPNPSKGNFSISGMETNEKLKLEVRDVQGKLVFETDNLSQETNSFELEVENGVYFVTVEGGLKNRKMVEKIVLMR